MVNLRLPQWTFSGATSTIEIEILVFRVCFGDKTPVRPENKQINVFDSSSPCHLKIVKASQQNAICSIIKARWGPFIRFRIKSYFCLFLCNEGLLAGPFVQLVYTFCKVFGKLTGVRAALGILKRPSAVNQTHCLTGMKTPTTSLSSGLHMISENPFRVRRAPTIRLDFRRLAASHWAPLVVLRSSGAAWWSSVSRPVNLLKLKIDVFVGHYVGF